MNADAERRQFHFREDSDGRDFCRADGIEAVINGDGAGGEFTVVKGDNYPEEGGLRIEGVREEYTQVNDRRRDAGDNDWR